MIASLYQRGSALAVAVARGFVLALVCASTSSLRRRRDSPDGKWQFRRIEPYPLQLAVPDKAALAHQIADDNGGIVAEVPFPQRDLDRRLLRHKRIEADR